MIFILCITRECNLSKYIDKFNDWIGSLLIVISSYSNYINDASSTHPILLIYITNSIILHNLWVCSYYLFYNIFFNFFNLKSFSSKQIGESANVNILLET